jgi:hypothetical protein
MLPMTRSRAAPGWHQGHSEAAIRAGGGAVAKFVTQKRSRAFRLGLDLLHVRRYCGGSGAGLMLSSQFAVQRTPIRCPPRGMLFGILSLAVGLHAQLTPVHRGGSTLQRIQSLSLPLAFEPSQGRASQPGSFLAQGPGYAVRLTSSGATLSVSGAGATGRRPKTRARGSAQAGGAPREVQIRMTGPRAQGRMSAEGQLPGTVNYILGSDPAKWRTAIPTYSTVRYSAVYSGIDLVYYGNQQRLEFDYDVAPAGDRGGAGERVRQVASRRRQGTC